MFAPVCASLSFGKDHKSIIVQRTRLGHILYTQFDALFQGARQLEVAWFHQRTYAPVPHTPTHTIMSYTFWYLIHSQPWLFLPWIMQIQRCPEAGGCGHILRCQYYFHAHHPVIWWSGMDAESVFKQILFHIVFSQSCDGTWAGWLWLKPNLDWVCWLGLFLCAWPRQLEFLQAVQVLSAFAQRQCCTGNGGTTRNFWDDSTVDSFVLNHFNLVSVSICRIKKRVMWIVNQRQVDAYGQLPQALVGLSHPSWFSPQGFFLASPLGRVDQNVQETLPHSQLSMI